MARGRTSQGGDGIILLHATEKGALTASGSSQVTVEGGRVVINSNNPEAGVSSGGIITAEEGFHIVGEPGISGTEGAFVGTIPQRTMQLVE